MSSALLNAQLITAETKQVTEVDAATIIQILNRVGSEDYDDALRAIDSILAEDRHTDVRVLLLWTKSNIYQRKRQVPDEMDALIRLTALKLHPVVELNLGIAYSRMGNRKEAEVHIVRAIELMRGVYPLAIFNLGILYCDMERFSEARQQLRDLERSREKVPAQLVQKLRDRVAVLS